MQILQPLTQTNIALVWGGVMISAIGDEFYNVAVLWVAVTYLGPKAGLLVAFQCGIVLTAGLIAGAWAERWDYRRTMIRADLARAAFCLLPILGPAAGFDPVWCLVPMMIIVSGCKALFDPALQASLPGLSTDKTMLQSTNALFDATRRIARLSGPGLIALIGMTLPIAQFFTIDAVSFLASAFAVAVAIKSLDRPAVGSARQPLRERLLSGIMGGFIAVRGNSLMQAALTMHGVASAGWYIALILCAAIRVRELGLGIDAYGFIIAAYGTGNLLSTVAMGPTSLGRSTRMLFAGRVIAGIGYLGMGLSDSLPAMAAWAALAASGGPLGNIPFLSMLQRNFRSEDIARIYRLRMVVEWGGIALVLLASPMLLEAAGTAAAMKFCGLLVAAAGLWGIWAAPALERAKPETTPNSIQTR